jgi:hypothetical protein
MQRDLEDPMTTKKGTPGVWRALTAGLAENGWESSETEPGISLTIPCPPSEHEFPKRTERYALHARLAAPARVELRSTWRGKGSTARWVELAAFAAMVAPRLRGELVVDVTRAEVAFRTEHRWTANGYVGFERSMLQNMTTLGRLVITSPTSSAIAPWQPR